MTFIQAHESTSSVRLAECFPSQHARVRGKDGAVGAKLEVTLVCVGRLRESSLRRLSAEYEKRLQRYGNLSVHEVAHEKLRSKKGSALAGVERLFCSAQVRVALDRQGKRLSSRGLATFLNEVHEASQSLSFLIGGPDGIPDPLLSKATHRMSFSDLTFPHELFRVMVLEQIYRAFTIVRGVPYHK